MVRANIYINLSQRGISFRTEIIHRYNSHKEN